MVHIFTDTWSYTLSKTLPKVSTSSIKYINGFFYFGSLNDIYKTTTSFVLAATYTKSNYGFYSIFWDSKNSLIYASANKVYPPQVLVFNSALTLMSFIPYSKATTRYPYGVSYYGGIVWIGQWNTNLMGQVQSCNITQSTLTGCYSLTLSSTECSASTIAGITFDSHGYMLVTCSNTNTVAVYNTINSYYNPTIGNSFGYMNSMKKITTHNNGKIVASYADSKGRLVVFSTYSIDILF
jgi:hypothetical protein